MFSLRVGKSGQWLLASSLLVGCSGGATPDEAEASTSTVGNNVADSSGGDTASTGTTPTSGSSEASTSAGESSDGGTCAAQESCDGQDNNCDGEVDEGCECIVDQTQPCYSGDRGTRDLGSCRVGVQICTTEGTWGACTDEVVPSAESCNGADDDCDGEIDEDFGSESCGEGACQVTVEICSRGIPARCEPGTPSDEICNELDDDCDGEIDEGCACVDGRQQPCYPGAKNTVDVGMCQSGHQTCSRGQWAACEDAVVPSVEVCDGLDNDCDGEIDEGAQTVDTECDTGAQGVCATGHYACDSGQLVCHQDRAPETETCDGLDNNCDGQIDEGSPGAGLACNTGLFGVCAAGATQCVDGAISCMATTAATAETCDGRDNDCDNQIDEGNPQGFQTCDTGMAGACSAGLTSCTPDGLRCDQRVHPTTEICDGQDNDCDGEIDEDNPGGGASCFTGQLGACAIGVNDCTGGSVSCTQTVFPSEEICGNGNDDDCDGTADEDCGCAHNECTAGSALAADCSPCVEQLCAADAYCCQSEWDAVCVSEVQAVCGSWACSSCSHSACVQGPALSANCDTSVGSCVATICAADSYCCSTAWDSQCVNQVATRCNIACP